MLTLLHAIRDQLHEQTRQTQLIVYTMAGAAVLTPIALLGDGLGDVFLSTASLLFLARSIILRDFSWVREPWIAVGVVLWAYLIIRGLASVEAAHSSIKALAWIRFIVFGAALQFLVMRSPAIRQAILYAIIAMAVFAAADALFQFVVGYDIFGRPIYSKTRLTGPLKDPSIGALLLIMGMSAIVYWCSQISSSTVARTRLLAAGCLVMVLVAILLSGERMVLIETVVVLLLITLATLRHRPITLVACVLAVAGIAAGLLAALPEVRQRQLSSLAQLSDPHNSIYGKAMLAGIEVIKDYPVFGVGLKNFEAHCRLSVEDIKVADACRLPHPHQTWLQITADTGFVGLSAFVALFALALWPALRLASRWGTESLMAGCVIGVLLKLGPFTAGNFFSNWREVIFWFSLATAAAVARTLQANTIARDQSAGHVSVERR